MKDTGGGMSDELQLMLLSGKNEQQKVNSTEIGLAIVKTLIKQLGSSIKFVSEINKGTTFWFSLPVIRTTQGKSVPFLDTVNTSINTLKMDELQLNYLFSKKNDFDCGGIYSKSLRKKDAEDIFQQILDINSDF